MKLLLIGAGTSATDRELLGLLKQRQIEYFAPEPEEIDDADADTLGELIERCAADQVVNLAAFAAGSQRAVIEAESDAAACKALNERLPSLLGSVCAFRAIPLVHLSTAHVFSGSKKLPYSERDTVRPAGVYGRTALAGEQALAQATEYHVILRPGWIFGPGQDERFRQWLTQVTRNDGNIPAQRRRFSPTAAEDLARVLLAITLQIDCDAAVWGVYHYCSAEGLREGEFLRELVTMAAQSDEEVYRLLDHLKINPVRVQPPEIANTTLATRKIFETFGIKQRSWRGSLQKLVKTWYD